MSNKEKKMFMNSFIKNIEIYEDELPNGRILKAIEFRFPIYSENGEIIGVRWDKNDSVETVVCLGGKK